MTKNKKILFLVVAIIFCIFIIVRFSSPEDTWICKDGLWIKHGNPVESAPDASLCVNENENLLKIYLNDNLSVVSPEKEVLGGKFYVTKIILISSDKAEVEYEDGHIALKAKFNFVINDGEVRVSDFVITK
ncbi:MAG: hypothetical protein WCW14_05215 [Candidatus Paceibacterota bacterium]|jgi:hypothetical protein